MLRKEGLSARNSRGVDGKNRLTLWHGHIGVGLIPGDKVGQADEAGVMLKICRDERLEQTRKFVI